MRITVLPLLVAALAAAPAAAQISWQEADVTAVPLGPRRPLAIGEASAFPAHRLPGLAEGVRTQRANSGRQALYGALVGAGAGLLAGVLLDSGGYSAGGEDDEEGGSTIWVMVPLGAAAGALVAVLL